MMNQDARLAMEYAVKCGHLRSALGALLDCVALGEPVSMGVLDGAYEAMAETKGLTLEHETRVHTGQETGWRFAVCTCGWNLHDQDQRYVDSIASNHANDYHEKGLIA